MKHIIVGTAGHIVHGNDCISSRSRSAALDAVGRRSRLKSDLDLITAVSVVVNVPGGSDDDVLHCGRSSVKIQEGSRPVKQTRSVKKADRTWHSITAYNQCKLSVDRVHQPTVIPEVCRVPRSSERDR